MFSIKLRHGSRFDSWKTNPIFSLGPVISSPSNKIFPVDGVIKPEIDHKRVVLPHPEGPTIETTLPSLTSKEQLSKALRLSKFFDSFCIDNLLREDKQTSCLVSQNYKVKPKDVFPIW